jgi:fructosamine-3-kinase
MNQLEDIIQKLEVGDLISKRSVSGGSINDAFEIETSSGKFFLKINSASRFPNMFEAEKRGLELLAQSSFLVPKPLKVGVAGDTQFILMEWIEKGAPKEGFWDQFGRSLAKLHSITSKQFGLDHDNYIGSLPQCNSEHGNWAGFYREDRLVPQMKLAEKNGRLTSQMKNGFEGLFRSLENIFPNENPSLLHGDLWSGNMMVAANGTPCIFDPAVYYGHREMDLAMMALFGGFGDAWVDAYNEVYTLESGWRERIPLGQLYPLMVHVNLFGGGYTSSVERILYQFT